MAEVVIPVGYGRGIFRFNVSGSDEEMTCGIGFKKGDAADALACATILYEEATGPLAPIQDTLMPDVMGFLGVRAYLMTSGGLTVADYGAAIDGEGAFNLPIINSTLLFSLATNFVGRQFRGRMYWPMIGIDESNVSPTGLMSGGSFNGMRDRFDSFLGALIALDGLQPYLLHAPPKEGATPAPTPITSGVLQSRVATQRRRIR